MSDIVHAPGSFSLSERIDTLCGRRIDQPMSDGGDGLVYLLTALNGNVFRITPERQLVTCSKCLKMLGPAPMTNRVGPPTPRNAPWSVPAECLAQVADPAPNARQAAWRAWIAAQNADGYRMSAQERACARAAWDAGWDACEGSMLRKFKLER